MDDITTAIAPASADLARDVETVLPLTPMQQGMLFHSLLDPASAVFFQQLVAELDGEMSPMAFAAAWATLMARHQSLRTAFLWERRDEACQVVMRYAAAPMEWLDWSGLDDSAFAERLDAHLNADRARPFALAKAPLLRITMVRRAPDRHVLLLTHHHLILDGWSTGILLNEFLALYTGELRERPVVLPAAVPFAKYLESFARTDRQANLAFWRDTLAGLEQPTPLVGEHRRDGSGGEFIPLDLHLPVTIKTDLDDLARRHRVSASIPLFAAWALTLARRAGQAEVVFGATIAGRPADLAGAERLVGLCINTIPLRLPTPASGDLGGWLRQIQDRLARTRPYELSSLSDIQTASGLPNGVPLFESIVVYENYPVEMPSPEAALRVNHARVEERANYPLTLLAEPQADGLALRLILDRTRLPEDEGRRILDQVATVLSGLAGSHDRNDLSSLSLLAPAERQRVLQDWNATEAPYDADATLHNLFLRQAARTPDAEALTDRNGRITYGELDLLSRRVADRIEAAGVPAGGAVAVRMLRDRYLIAGLLAILRSGRTYVPINRDVPPARIDEIVRVLDISCILTSTALKEETAHHMAAHPAMRMIAADDENAAPAPTMPDCGKADDLAYVIFTSGSTGRPKGVMVRHRPAINLVEWVNKTFAVGPSDRLLFVTSPAFDLSVYDIFGILAAGGSIRIADDAEIEDADKLTRILVEERITFWDSAPAALWQLHPLLPARVPASKLRLIFVSGDWVPLPLPDRMRACFDRVQVIALGGATEATVWSNYHVVDDVDPAWRSIPYGRPIQNARYYILDKALQPVPPNVPGDLYIGGDCLCDGYAGQPELTAERFLPDPYWDRYGARMYRTGDRAKFWPDGTMEFLGRDDHQVKVRGFRIELGEIEAALVRHPGVQDAVAVLHVTGEGGPASGREDREIVGYVVPRTGVTLDMADLTAYLRGQLPPPMMPAHLTELPALPLSGNGKVDRKALPAPALDSSATIALTGAGDTLHELIARIWADVLGLDSVPLDEDFFVLGGHSLRATSVIAHLRLALGLDLPLALLFQHPTVRALADSILVLVRNDGDGESNIPYLPRDRALPLSPAQKRLWFLHRLEPDSPFYTISLAAWLTGGLDQSALEQAVATVAARHEVLRSRIVEEDGKPELVPAAADEAMPIVVRDISAAPDPEAEALALARTESLRPFDLARDLPFRVLLVRTGAERALALVLVDHIAADGWSIGIFAQELLTAYDALASGTKPDLPPIDIQYADLATWQAKRLKTTLEPQLDYWRRALTGLPTLDLPTDRPRPAVQRFIGSVVPFALSRDASRGLADLVRQEACTLFMLTLAAFVIVLRHRTKQDDLVIGTDLAGRSHPAAEKLIGFFVNQLVLRIDLAGCMTFRDVLRTVRRRVLDGFFHQDVPFETLVRVLNPPRDPGRMPLFQVKFVLQNTQFADLGSRHLQVEPVEVATDTAKYDLLMTLIDRSEMIGTLEYSTDLFDRGTADTLVADFRSVLDQIVHTPAISVDALLAMLDAGQAERAELGRQNQRRAGLDRLRQLRRSGGTA